MSYPAYISLGFLAISMLFWGAIRLLGRKDKTKAVTETTGTSTALPALGDGLGRAVRDQFDLDKARIKELEQEVERLTPAPMSWEVRQLQQWNDSFMEGCVRILKEAPWAGAERPVIRAPLALKVNDVLVRHDAGTKAISQQCYLKKHSVVDFSHSAEKFTVQEEGWYQVTGIRYDKSLRVTRI